MKKELSIKETKCHCSSSYMEIKNNGVYITNKEACESCGHGLLNELKKKNLLIKN